ncbi:MAG: BMP family ABC transporter substrate-binding protein, partial [Candidatus Nanopelagicales bacterium]
MRRVTTLVAALAAATLVLSACGGDDDDDTSSGDTSSPTAQSDVRVGVAYDIGGRGDQSFNDSAAVGIDQAIDEYGVEVEELEASAGETDADKAERLRLLAEGGFNPVIAIGFAYSKPIGEVAAEYPDTNFAMIDDTANDLPNLANLVFAEEQGSFLVGVIAANASPNNNVGFIGGVEVELIKKFQAGFTEGVHAVKPDAIVQVQYLTQVPDFTGFNDPAKGKTAAEGMFDAGADIVFHAAGGSGGGLFEAAQAAGKLAIGVDSDQYLQPAYAAVKDVILTSMIKRVDIAVYEFIKSAVEGDTLTGNTLFDLEVDGVGYSTSNDAVSAYVEGVDDYAAQIVDGSLEVPT